MNVLFSLCKLIKEYSIYKLICIKSILTMFRLSFETRLLYRAFTLNDFGAKTR